MDTTRVFPSFKVCSSQLCRLWENEQKQKSVAWRQCGVKRTEFIVSNACLFRFSKNTSSDDSEGKRCFRTSKDERVVPTPRVQCIHFVSQRTAFMASKDLLSACYCSALIEFEFHCLRCCESTFFECSFLRRRLWEEKNGTSPTLMLKRFACTIKDLITFFLAFPGPDFSFPSLIWWMHHWTEELLCLSAIQRNFLIDFYFSKASLFLSFIKLFDFVFANKRNRLFASQIVIPLNDESFVQLKKLSLRRSFKTNGIAILLRKVINPWLSIHPSHDLSVLPKKSHYHEADSLLFICDVFASRLRAGSLRIIIGIILKVKNEGKKLSAVGRCHINENNYIMSRKSLRFCYQQQRPVPLMKRMTVAFYSNVLANHCDSWDRFKDEIRPYYFLIMWKSFICGAGGRFVIKLFLFDFLGFRDFSSLSFNWISFVDL